MLVPGLAEGADRLAAFVALGRGWKLHAVLAFHRKRFEEDFCGPHSVGEFRALLRSAYQITEPGPRWHLERSPEEGYDAMGAAMLNVSQELIAVWNGQGSRGKGGTVEVIEAAQDRGIPVVWVHATKSVPPKALTPSSDDGAKRRQRDATR
jgi:hypothetical protein